MTKGVKVSFFDQQPVLKKGMSHLRGLLDDRYFEHLSDLVKLEHQAQQEKFAAQRNEGTGDIFPSRGVVLLDLESIEEQLGFGGRRLVTFASSSKKLLATGFQPGDEVRVTLQNGKLESVANALVSRCSTTQIELVFDTAPPPAVFSCPIKLERTSSDVTYLRLLNSLARWKSFDRGPGLKTKEILLGRADPRFGLTAPRPLSPRLNREQSQAVTAALSAEDFFLIDGPPGTGKSTVLGEIARLAVSQGKRVLVTAASNAAVDHLLEVCLRCGLKVLRVGHPARVSPPFQAHTLDLVVQNHPDLRLSKRLWKEADDLKGYARKQRRHGRSVTRFSNARQSTAAARALIKEAKSLERSALRAVMLQAEVICATSASLSGGILEHQSFDLALVDESTQATEPLTLMAFLKAPTVIMAGDPQQLPPTVLSRQAAREGLARSLFERLLSLHGPDTQHLLTTQYRMSEVLMNFPSRTMYGGRLVAHPSIATERLEGIPPLIFLDTAGKGLEETLSSAGGSWSNPGEAVLLADWARRLIQGGLNPRDVAVIAPYRAQVAALRALLPESHFAELEIDTIDSFQGREKDAVLLSLTRSNPRGDVGFLADLRRMNVGLTRARKHLFIVGDSATLFSHPFYRELVTESQSTNAYQSIWNWEIGH